MSGPAVLRYDGHPHDYGSWGNREFIRDSGTSWVKLWVSWHALQQNYEPRSREDAWFDLNMAPGGQAWLWRLDRQVRAAQDDGRGVMLAIYHAHPTWASGARTAARDPSRPPAHRVPGDLSTEGPWGWFVEYLCARYNGRINPVGPHRPYPGERASSRLAATGNPLGARIDALEICNEPNILLWPQDGLPGAVASMIRSAAVLSERHDGPIVLAPSTVDAPDPGEVQDPGSRTDWRTFTSRLLRELRSFRPPLPVGWSHHNYRDTARGPSAQESRANALLGLLREERWPGWDGRLWLTEGGVNLFPDQDGRTAQREQARRITSNFEQMRKLPDVFMWTQHAIHDETGSDFKSGLRGEFRYGPDPGPAPARPALSAWARLPGSRTP
jgi:hypothetical protein